MAEQRKLLVRRAKNYLKVPHFQLMEDGGQWLGLKYLAEDADVEGLATKALLLLRNETAKRAEGEQDKVVLIGFNQEYVVAYQFNYGTIYSSLTADECERFAAVFQGKQSEA